MTTAEPDDATSGSEPSDSRSAPGAPTAEELRRALKAFKKRLKLARLDDESRLGQIMMNLALNSVQAMSNWISRLSMPRL